MHPNSLWPTVAVIGVALAWFMFAAGFVVSIRKSRAKVTKRDALSAYGLLIEFAAMCLVWGVRRPVGSTLFPAPATVQAIIAFMALLLAGWSVALVSLAVRALGKQLNVQAKIVEGHELVTHGPYAIVRHPIYSSLLTMLIATGLAFSRWWMIVPALVLFVMGTSLRIRSEERLLRGTFGGKFDDYARRVPALLPRFWSCKAHKHHE